MHWLGEVMVERRSLGKTLVMEPIKVRGRLPSAGQPRAASAPATAGDGLPWWAWGLLAWGAVSVLGKRRRRRRSR